MQTTIIKSPNRPHVLIGLGYVKPMTSGTQMATIRKYLGVGVCDQLTDDEYDILHDAATDPRALVQADKDRFGHEKSYAHTEQVRRILIDTHPNPYPTGA